MSSNSPEQSGSFSDLKHDEAVISSPGALLRNKRLALSMNEWDIAREMRLQVQYILDLEADNFDAFSSLAFIRGYLRGYAKLVGVPEAEIMHLFNQLALQDKTVATMVPKYITRGKSQGDRYWRWMGLAVLGFVVLSLMLWWQNYNSSFKTINTSVNNTLQKVTALQNTLNTQSQNPQTQAPTQATIPAPTASEVNNTLGTSANLLGDVTQPVTPTQNSAPTAAPANNNTVVSTPAPVNNTTASTPAPTNATTPLSPSNTTMITPQASGTATTPAVSPATTPSTTVAAPTPTARKKSRSRDLSSAHDPIVDGQSPRLDTTNE